MSPDPTTGTPAETDSQATTPSGSGSGTEATAPSTLGRYQIRGELGRGSFGIVYRAFDPELAREVAVKLLRADSFPSESEQATFVHEARIAASLSHPGIVTVHDVGRGPDGACFVVMELILGGTLEKELQASEQRTSRQLEMVAAVAGAVHHIHTRGLVHRDIKPANILIDAAGKPYLSDFGLAIHDRRQHLNSGEVSGTPCYMAPEQTRGEAHRLDGRSDIWSLGVILYELLAGRRPFVGRTKAELFDEILHREPKPLRQIDERISPQLAAIVSKCLSKSVADRYPTALDFAADLTAALQASAGVEASQRSAGAARAGDPSLAPRRIAAAAQVGTVGCSVSLAFMLLIAVGGFIIGWGNPFGDAKVAMNNPAPIEIPTPSGVERPTTSYPLPIPSAAPTPRPVPMASPASSYVPPDVRIARESQRALEQSLTRQRQLLAEHLQVTDELSTLRNELAVADDLRRKADRDESNRLGPYDAAKSMLDQQQEFYSSQSKLLASKTKELEDLRSELAQYPKTRANVSLILRKAVAGENWLFTPLDATAEKTIREYATKLQPYSLGQVGTASQVPSLVLGSEIRDEARRLVEEYERFADKIRSLLDAIRNAEMALSRRNLEVNELTRKFVATKQNFDDASNAAREAKKKLEELEARHTGASVRLNQISATQAQVTAEIAALKEKLRRIDEK